MKKIIIITFLFIVLFGCTELTREEQNLCLSLTSQSYDYIPTCETENSCFTKLDSLFKTDLGFEVENKLYTTKNHFARSWYFYNKGLSEIKKVKKSCQTNAISALPGQINQARYYLNESFKEMDFGLKTSIEIIALEENYLSKEEIDLLKEDDLFYNLTTLRQILADLESNNTTSNNYLSNYLKQFHSILKY